MEKSAQTKQCEQRQDKTQTEERAEERESEGEGVRFIQSANEIGFNKAYLINI